MIRGSAHAKVILLGEHAVVHGIPAIAAGLDRGVTAHAKRAAEATLDLGPRRLVPGDDATGRAFAALLDALTSPPMRVTLDAAIPLGTGLGGSAAIGVAVARAVTRVLDPNANPRSKEVLAAADAWERVFHGNPSGIDVRAAVHGGCIWYTREEGAKPIDVARPIELAIAIAGPPARTHDMVESVEKLTRARPDIAGKTFSGIEVLVKNARLAIEVGQLRDLGKLMDLNQMLLAGLFVSTEGIETACRLARDAGALGAKLTGAGGGGCVIALVESDPTNVLTAWRANGIEGFSARIASSVGEVPA